MRIKLRQFPHPVLSHFSDDLIDCEYQSTPRISVTKNTYDFKVTAVTSSPDLRGLLASGKAMHVIHLDCSTTRYRSVFKSNDKNFSFQIDSKYLEGKVEISKFIVAEEEILEYSNGNFHPDYDGVKFTIKSGDILALTESEVFDAEKEIDPLKNIPSIFSIKVSSNHDAPPIDVILDEKIYIYLSEENYRRFTFVKLNQGIRPVLVQMVLFPALIYVLNNLRVASEEEGMTHEDKRWYKVLDKKLKDLDVDLEKNIWPNIESTITLAQRLIGDPLINSLKALEGMEEEI